MATPKVDRTITEQLRRQLDAYAQELADGGYTDKVQTARYKHARDFVLFLEGNFSPAADKGKVRHNTSV